MYIFLTRADLQIYVSKLVPIYFVGVVGSPSAWESAATVVALSGLPAWRGRLRPSLAVLNQEEGSDFGDLSISYQFSDPRRGLVGVLHSHIMSPTSAHIRENSVEHDH